MQTLGEAIVDGLQAYGIDTVFGIPGVHTVELYRGLAASKIRHVTPRHEQGAGFMADGYFRTTGRVAAAFVITGPGLTNILTPMAQAYADSIPMLVVSSVNRTAALGMGGDLHEIRNQNLIAAQASAFSHRITDPDQIPSVLARAWAVFESARPRPVHIEVPLDLFSTKLAVPMAWRRSTNPAPEPGAIDDVAALLGEAQRPLILAGGGSVNADVGGLAARLDAPIVTTVNGRGTGSLLEVPASPSLQSIRTMIADSDVVLALGTEFGRTDYDMYDRGGFEVPGELIRVDIDQEQTTKQVVPTIAYTADCGRFVQALIRQMGGAAPVLDGAGRATAARENAWREIGEKYQRVTGFVNLIRDTLPGVPIVCDSTQAAYAGNLYYAAPARRLWFNASTGYGALGYGLPAAVGAAHGLSGPVVCIAGDGGLQFSIADLGTAVEENLPLILIVWNNRGYGEIKDYMVDRQITPVGVDLHTPDFVEIGKAYGATSVALKDLGDLPNELTVATERQGPTLIEVDEELVLNSD
ncbi:MAG: 5-guanidino-2-oxopentanoate decarboxylase [Pseudomonadota bacterium]